MDPLYGVTTGEASLQYIPLDKKFQTKLRLPNQDHMVLLVLQDSYVLIFYFDEMTPFSDYHAFNLR